VREQEAENPADDVSHVIKNYTFLHKTKRREKKVVSPW